MSGEMGNVHVVSHTHWDREWYRPFQLFRLKLVHMVDGLLDLLASDPDYRHFMLDGQTIVLDDYLQIRPERGDEIRGHVANGRLLIGPWFVLADEFLVSPESLIRNLLEGERSARRMGSKMDVGYTPDAFGHIGQLPQILRGFGIESAALERGLGDVPCEMWWEAPDGSRVLLANLRDGYGNAALLPSGLLAAGDPSAFEALLRLIDSLRPYAANGHVLLMQGTDHSEAQPATTAALAHAAQNLPGDAICHSTLPAYIAAVQAELPNRGLPVITGELRSSQRHHLLPGVLSTRTWIKQCNHTCETLLEKWAEPFGAWANLAVRLHGSPPAAGDRVTGPAAIVRQAWRLLMECHAHDSICGCSIDQVHDEMRPRFDQVEQIGEEITRQSLLTLANAADTGGQPGAVGAVVVFNPVGATQTDTVTFDVQLPLPLDVVDEVGNVAPYEVVAAEVREVAHERLDRDGLYGLLAIAQEGGIGGMALSGVTLGREGGTLHIHARLVDGGQADTEPLGAALEEFIAALADDTLTSFDVRAVIENTTLRMLARDIPAHGYRTFWLRPGASEAPAEVNSGRMVTENEYLALEADPGNGTFTITDRRTGTVYPGLGRLVDGGDCGDEYNYCPPPGDTLISVATRLANEGGVGVRPLISPVRRGFEMTYGLPLPAGLTANRERGEGEVILVVRTVATLAPGVPRVDFTMEVDNRACDHRLRVHFRAPFHAETGDHDGHFEVVRRSAGVPEHDDTWAEQPRPEVPQRAWTSISNGRTGLTVAARGLREVEVVKGDGEGSEIALTLLRCVGWLSRDDFATRRGHAGPPYPTPGAQNIGSHRFEFSVIPHVGRWQNAFLDAYAFDAPMRAVVTSTANGPLPASASLLSAAPPAFVISAVKEAEDGSGLVMRGYNISGEPITVTVAPLFHFESALRVGLDESGDDELPISADGSVTFSLRPHGIATTKFSARRGDADSSRESIHPQTRIRLG